MKALIIKPRLDIPFKDFGQSVPSHIEKYETLSEIRKYWFDYVEILKKRHPYHDVLESPLYKLDKNHIRDIGKNYSIVYVPHRQKIDFDCGHNVRYYMQTVFPYLFTEDHLGWGASMSFCPVDAKKVESDSFELLRKRFLKGKSKFRQPSLEWLKDENYFLFLCQIPHDDTIKYHSDVSVEEALIHCIEVSKRVGKKLVVKGHPANPSSMERLRMIAKDCIWSDKISLTSLIQKCDRVFTVNSGTGFEATLLEKPVISYGRAEYSRISYTPDIYSDLEDQCNGIISHTVSRDQCENLINTFVKHCTNVEKIKKEI